MRLVADLVFMEKHSKEEDHVKVEVHKCAYYLILSMNCLAMSWFFNDIERKSPG